MQMRYVIALGSNRRHVRHGRPEAVLSAAVKALEEAGITVLAVAPTVASAPLGPSARRYANGAALVETGAEPPALLGLLQAIEARFGRRRRGQRWGARVLDLDIVLWEHGCWGAADLIIPHIHFRDRTFVLGPVRAIAGRWRDPVSGQSVTQLHARLTRPHTLPNPPPNRPLRRKGP